MECCKKGGKVDRVKTSVADTGSPVCVCVRVRVCVCVCVCVSACVTLQWVKILRPTYLNHITFQMQTTKMDYTREQL